ncbi:MAG TPA: IS1380 family transposase [Candidatus Saccharimonadales bacterium]|nr:IS1380 family transposase [Candidatus Saccharimonadales bacterium]
MNTSLTASSRTDCKEQPLLFQDLGSRQVVADFSGGTLSSDGGALLLRQMDINLGLTQSLAQCFRDTRQQVYVDHSVAQLLAQRLYGLALGYEDLNDHQRLRLDPLLAAACEKLDPLGQDRFNPAHRGVALAGASTLNRLELSNNRDTRGHKLSHDPGRIEACLLQMGVRCLPKYAQEIVVDLDAMGHRLHGMQEGRHYRAYYDEYCYLPLYVFVGGIPLWAQLRTGDKDGADGVVAALDKIVPAIRKRCRRARILLRGDSGFCREAIMAWCEKQEEVYYCLGLAKNSVLVERLGPALTRAQIRWCLSGAANVRQFAEFDYQTVRSWSRFRRVIGKAEVTAQGSNPRFIVTNLPAHGCQGEEDKSRFIAARLYEELYCARGEMENMLKQQTLDLRADRMSTHYLASNQLRLWLATLAYLLLERMRTLGLAGTDLAQATAGSVRLKLLKVAGQVRVSVRRVYVQLNSAYPMQALFRLCHRRLMALRLASG